MKLPLTLLLVLLVTAKGQNLRNDEGKRRRRRLNADTINTAIANQLPTINALLQGGIPDPTTADQTVSVTFTNGLTSLACPGADVALEGNIQNVTDTSTLTINSLTVVEGTETSMTDCFGINTDFSGTFDFDISAAAVNALGTLMLTASTGTCGDYSSTFTGTIVNPRFTGQMYLEGQILLNFAIVSTARVDTITGMCDDATFTPTDPIPDDFSSIEAEFEATMKAEMKTYVEDVLPDEIKNVINSNLGGARTNLGLGGGLPLILQMYRSGVENKFNNMVNTTEGRVETLRVRAEEGVQTLKAQAEQRVADLEAQATNQVNSWRDTVTEKINSWTTAGSEFVNRYGFEIGGPAYR